MNVALVERSTPSAAAPLGGLRLIVLARAACDEGATRGELMRELGPSIGPDLASRLPLEAEIAALVRAGLVIEMRSRFSASPSGLDNLFDALAIKSLPKTWIELRDIRLVAKALGLQAQAAARLKGLSKPDVLRAEIVIEAFGLGLKGTVSASRLRAALALVALERAFGNKIKGELTTSTGFNAKAARVLAGQLLKRPRDAGTDKRLVTLLAAEAVGTPKLDADSLRAGLLRRLAGAPLREVPSRQVMERQSADLHAKAPPKPVPAPAADKRPPAAARPDLPGFVTIVKRQAAEQAEGWAGSRKALISRVYGSIAALHPEWGLSLVEFKAMLAECHRIGHVVLTTADLKDKRQLDDIRQSAIAYKNTVWHLIRIED